MEEEAANKSSNTSINNNELLNDGASDVGSSNLEEKGKPVVRGTQACRQQISAKESKKA